MTDKSPQSKIITITGTKGKTSLARLLDYALAPYWESVVSVESQGAYHNNELRFDDEQSRELWGYGVTNAPGRFMTLHSAQPALSILEATLFSRYTGLAYKRHDVGVFLNVYDDHLGAHPKINSRQKIAEMKNFVFRRLKADGTAIYNADDALVREQLTRIPESARTCAVTLEAHEASEAELICTVQDDCVVIRDKAGQVGWSIPLRRLSWLQPEYKPSLYLALFAVAIIYTAVPAAHLPQIEKRLMKYEFDPEGGRLVKSELPNGAHLLMDNAHESVSLRQVATLARSIAGAKHKVIGVLRLAPSRQQALIETTAQAIYDCFDTFVIYDKVDGYFRKPALVRGYSDKQEEAGKMARLFADALRRHGQKPVHEIVREDEAIGKAVKLSGKGDVIVYIVGDNPGRSREFVKHIEQESRA